MSHGLTTSNLYSTRLCAINWHCSTPETDISLRLHSMIPHVIIRASNGVSVATKGAAQSCLLRNVNLDISGFSETLLNRRNFTRTDSKIPSHTDKPI